MGKKVIIDGKKGNFTLPQKFRIVIVGENKLNGQPFVTNVINVLGAANNMIMEWKNIPKKSFTHLTLLEKHRRLLHSKRTRISKFRSIRIGAL